MSREDTWNAFVDRHKLTFVGDDPIIEHLESFGKRRGFLTAKQIVLLREAVRRDYSKVPLGVNTVTVTVIGVRRDGRMRGRLEGGVIVFGPKTPGAQVGDTVDLTEHFDPPTLGGLVIYRKVEP